MLEFNNRERWWPSTGSRCSVQYNQSPAPKVGLQCVRTSWAEDLKIAAPLGTEFCFRLVRQGQHCRRGLSAQAGNQKRVKIEDFWPLDPLAGFSRGSRKWDSEKKMEIVVVAPPYSIWNCDCYSCKCLLENVQVSAGVWGWKAPIWMWSPYGFSLSFRMISG